jgi:hypothetical protein
MILSSHGIVGSQITQFTGLLDTYSGAAAAYSLRKLRTAYTGSAIRVRRASDNTEQNIGFVNNVLDTSALTTFCSGTNGFVTTWYDQSGNGYDATQTTAASQPQIVSSGSVILENAKPALNFLTITSHLVKLNITSFLGYSHIVVAKPLTTTTDFCHFIGLEQGNGAALGVRATLKLYDFNGGIGNINALNNTIAINEQVLLYSQNISNTSELFKNGTSISTATGTTATRDDVFLGNGGTALFGTKNIQEYILYPSNQSSNRTGIESNINSFYSIY